MTSDNASPYTCQCAMAVARALPKDHPARGSLLTWPSGYTDTGAPAWGLTLDDITAYLGDNLGTILVAGDTEDLTSRLSLRDLHKWRRRAGLIQAFNSRVGSAWVGRGGIAMFTRLGSGNVHVVVHRNFLEQQSPEGDPDVIARVSNGRGKVATYVDHRRSFIRRLVRRIGADVDSLGLPPCNENDVTDLRNFADDVKLYQAKYYLRTRHHIAAERNPAYRSMSASELIRAVTRIWADDKRQEALEKLREHQANSHRRPAPAAPHVDGAA